MFYDNLTDKDLLKEFEENVERLKTSEDPIYGVENRQLITEILYRLFKEKVESPKRTIPSIPYPSSDNLSEEERIARIKQIIGEI